MSAETPKRGKPHILVVEDDEETRTLVREALIASGHSVEAVGTVAAADRLARTTSVSAVILDVWLPDGDGTQVCRAWRRAGLTMPVLMLTARTDVAARVSGLESGADDYLGKPFAMAELHARVAALLRRAARPMRRAPYRRGSVVVDFARRQAFDHDQEIPITRRELAVLERLADDPGEPVAREVLLEAVWGEATREAGASLEVLVARIRGKLDPDGRVGLIRTVRGVGYAIGVSDRSAP
jgi:two-component system OmpR family response regulator